MRELVANFPQQLEEAYQIGQSTTLNITPRKFDNVIICGLGGSGIGGKIFSDYLRNQLSIPVIVNNEYDIPAFVSENTLAIVASYSGNTEETLSSINYLFEAKATIACITSGGEVKAIAESKNLPKIEIPGGMPPRACLGYSLVQFFFLFHAYGLITDQALEEIKNCASYLKQNTASIEKEALKVANQIGTKIPVIYCTKRYEGVAIRFRQQINENSKGLAWHHIIPEMNHNELVGWTSKNEDLVNVMFHDDEDLERNKVRMEFTKNVTAPFVSSQIDIHTQGSNLLEKFMYLIHLGDWVSVQIAEQKNIDPVEVNIITQLKNQLSSFE